MGCGCARKKKANQITKTATSSARSKIKRLPIITIRRNKSVTKKK